MDFKTLLAKAGNGEELTTDESVVMLTHVVERQQGQIDGQSKQINELTSACKTYETAIVELQNAVTELQQIDMNRTQFGEAVSSGGILLG